MVSTLYIHQIYSVDWNEQMNLVIEAINAKNWQQARANLKVIAEQNENYIQKASAQYQLGMMYYKGFDLQDYNVAKEYFEKAATQEYPGVREISDKFIQQAAKAQLGAMYYLGDGVAKNLATAKKYFDEVIAMGEHDKRAAADAKFYLGTMYLQGEGVNRDLVKAKEYLQKAAYQNDNRWAQAGAHYRLGLIDYLGNDFKNARDYFTIVANQDANIWAKAGAFYFLGKIFSTDTLGTKKDLAKAKNYLQQAASLKEGGFQEKAKELLEHVKEEQIKEEIKRIFTISGSETVEQTEVLQKAYAAYITGENLILWGDYKVAFYSLTKEQKNNIKNTLESKGLEIIELD